MNNDIFPKVTIMVPTYNQEKFIQEAVESALRQDYGNLEIVIADDCSSDGTVAAVEKFLNDPRVRYFRNEKNLGRVGNYRDTLFYKSTGDWVVNLDGDDYFTSSDFISTAISSIIAQESKGGDIDIVAYLYGQNVKAIDKYTGSICVDSCSRRLSGKEYFIHYYKIASFSHMNVLYRRDAAKKYDCYTKPYQASDFHSLMRLFLTGEIIADSRRIGQWRVHGSNTTILDLDKRQEEARETFDDLQEFAGAYFPARELAAWRREMDSRAYRDYVYTCSRYFQNIDTLKLLLSVPSLRRGWFREIFRQIFKR